MKISYLTQSLMVSALVMAFSASASDGVAEHLKKAATQLETKLHSTAPSLREHKIAIDPVAGAYQKKHGEAYFPVQFTGRRFLTDKSGSVLIDPQSMYLLSENGPAPAGGELIKLDMSSPGAAKWPSMKVPSGVEKRGDLYVISDPTCGYCQRVDAEAQRYLDSGIEIHYIPYPRSGVQDTSQPSFSRWAAAACAENPAVAYHEISMGKLDKYQAPADMSAACTDVIRDGFAYGQLLGITGTPYLYAVSVDGTKSVANPGYIPAETLAPRIGVLLKEDAAAALMK